VVKHNNLFNGSELYLRDNKLQTETRLTVGAAYDFSVNDAEVGSNERRFEIFYKSTLQNQPVNEFAAVLLGNAIERNDGIQVMITNTEDTKVAVELFNMQGVRLAVTYAQSGVVNLPASGLAAGMYAVRCTRDGKTILLKLMIK